MWKIAKLWSYEKVMKLWKVIKVIEVIYTPPKNKYVFVPGFFKILEQIFGIQFLFLFLTLLISVFNLVDFVFNLVEFIFRRPKTVLQFSFKLLDFSFKNVVFHFQTCCISFSTCCISFSKSWYYISCSIHLYWGVCVWGVGGRLWSRVPARVLSPRLGDPTEGPVLG